MPKSTDICILETESHTEHFPYRSPAKFGGRVVNDVTLFNVSVCAGFDMSGNILPSFSNAFSTNTERSGD
jgi:hypothetical protein